jgi:hypothetical protein
MNLKGSQRSNNHRIDKHLYKNHTHQLGSLVKANPEPHPVLGNKMGANVIIMTSQAVNELRTVNEVLSKPDPRMQENEAFGSYVALALENYHKWKPSWLKMTLKYFDKIQAGDESSAFPMQLHVIHSRQPHLRSYSWPRFTPIGSPITIHFNRIYSIKQHTRKTRSGVICRRAIRSVENE